MIALHWVFVVKLTLLLIIHKFFLNTHCPCRWKFSSTSVSILINDSYGRSWYISQFFISYLIYNNSYSWRQSYVSPFITVAFHSFLLVFAMTTSPLCYLKIPFFSAIIIFGSFLSWFTSGRGASAYLFLLASLSRMFFATQMSSVCSTWGTLALFYYIFWYSSFLPLMVNANLLSQLMFGLHCFHWFLVEYI